MGQRRSGRGSCRVKWSMRWCVHVRGPCVCARARPRARAGFALPLAFWCNIELPLSWATRGPCYVFFFFLSSQETRTNCCAVAIGAGRFVFSPTFIPGTSPSTVTVETRATPTLFPSTSLPSMIYRCFLFLIYHTAPAYQHFSGQSSI